MVFPDIEYIKKDLKNLPTKEGVYFLYNKERELFYIGISQNLKSRLSSHYSYFKNRLKYFMLLSIASFPKTIEQMEWLLLSIFRPKSNNHLPYRYYSDEYYKIYLKVKQKIQAQFKKEVDDKIDKEVFEE